MNAHRKIKSLVAPVPTEEQARGRELQHGRKLALQKVYLVLERGVNDSANNRPSDSRTVKRFSQT